MTKNISCLTFKGITLRHCQDCRYWSQAMNPAIQFTGFLKVALVTCQSAIENQILQSLFNQGQVTLTTVDSQMSLGGKLRQENFDVLLLDWSQSQGSGNLLASLSYQLPTLVIVKPEQEELGARSLQAGVQDYLLTTELGERNIRRAIRNAIQRQQQLKNLETKISQDTAQIQEEIKRSQRIYALLQSRQEPQERQTGLGWGQEQIEDKIKARIQELLEQEETCRLIFSNISEVVFQTDREGNWTFLNPAWTAMTGFCVAESIGQPMLEFIAPEDRRYYETCWQHLIEQPNLIYCQELCYVRKDESYCRVKVYVRLLKAQDGRILGMAGMLQEIQVTEGCQSPLGETAIASVQHQDKFLANLYHEIRTPISGILGIVDLVLQTKLTAQQQDFLKTLRSSADNLLVMINDLLDISKLDAGAMHLEMIDFDLGRCIEEVMELLAVPANNHNAELFYFLDPDVPLNLKGDPYRLRQVLMNLLSNAVKFTENGEVTVRVSLEETEPLFPDDPNVLDKGLVHPVKLRLEVQDTGVGISPENQSRLFQFFSQVNTSITRKHGGTGLGLVICKQLVELMDGEIGVESEQGKGSTFWFTATFVPSAPSCIRKPLNLLEGLKLLVIDDSITRQQMIRSHTQTWGVECDEVLSFQRGIEQLNQGLLVRQSYDVVIIDLPSTQVAQKLLEQVLRKNKDGVHTCWIVMISVHQHQQFESLQSQGVSYYLLKPLQPSRLLSSLCEVASVQTPMANPEMSTQAPSSPSLGNLNILLVEDTPISRKVILNQLKILGLSADWVSDGQQALEQLAVQNYDLVLMDCSMPVLDGYETTRYLRQREEGQRHTVVIALTAGCQATERERCFAAGMDDYVNKPLSLQDLEARIRRWCTQTPYALPQNRAQEFS